MKQMLIILLVTICFIFLSSMSVFADTTDTQSPTPIPTVSASQAQSDASKPFVDFATGMDSFMGGFIFYTPDPTANPIVMKSGQVLGTLTNFKNAFFIISFPIAVLLIVIRGLEIVLSENKMVVQDFFIHLLKYAVALAVVPTILSLSVQATNGLNDKIMTINTQAGTPQLSSFITNYNNDTKNQVNNGGTTNAFSIFNLSQIFQNSLAFAGQVAIYLLTWLFLIFGMVFISFQMIIRFLSLMLLSVFMPIVLPFILWDKSEGIVWAFFKGWVTFLIHQPAFILGFMIVTNILNNALAKNGASSGMLLFYAGSLFFLGGVNVLASRIFGDPWQAIATNMQGIGIGNFVTGTVSQFGKGVFGRNATMLSNSAIAGVAARKAGKYAGKGTVLTAKTIGKGTISAGQKLGLIKKGKEKEEKKEEGDDSNSSNGLGGTNTNTMQSTKGAPLSTFTEVLKNKGLTTQADEKQRGVISVSGKMFSYKDQKTGLESLYPTRSDGLIDGIPEDQLKAKNVSGLKVIDTSKFDGKKYKKPYNAFVTQKALSQGKPSGFAHITLTSDPKRVKNYLDFSKEKRINDGIKGVVVTRFGNFGGKRTKEQIVRIFTTDEV